MRAVTTALLPRAAPLLAALGAAQHHGRFSRRFHARPSFAGQERTWRADRPVGLDGVNRSWLPSPTELEAQPLVRRSKQFARDLRNWGRYAKALRCVACNAPLTEVRTPCVGLGSLVVSFAQAYARAVAAGNTTRLAQDQCGWFAKDQSRSCSELFGCYAPSLQEACPPEACGVLAKPSGVKLLRKWGPTLHFSAVLYLALHGHLGLNREAPPPLGRADCAVVHVRRGDACVNTNRRCHSNDEYVEAARQLKDAYGLESLRVVSDDGNLPLDRWRRLGYDVEVLSRSEAYDVSRSVAGAAKSLRDHFPEKRMARGELGPTATQDALRDMLGPRTLECRAPRGNIDQPSAPAYSSLLDCRAGRAFVGSFSASMSKAIFAQLLIRHRRVPPFVSVGGCVRQARFFDADAEEYPRCAASPPTEAERRRNRAAALRERRERFGRVQNRDTLRDPPVCAARLLGKRGVLAVAGADLGAAAATVFFTAVVNHALHAERFDLLPWASLGLADNPLVYDRGRHDGKQGLWATYFEPLESTARRRGGPSPARRGDGAARARAARAGVALRRAFDDGAIADPCDPERGDVVCATLRAPELCAELDTCPRVASSVAQFFNKTVNASQVPVFRKSGQWRLWMHKKAPWNVRAWYYGPKRTLPRNLTTYNASWFASQRSRAHRALQKYVRFRGDVVKRAAEVLDALASSKETDLLAVQPGASKCLVGVHARGTDADGRRSVQPVEAYVAVLAPVCSQLGSALAVYVATRAEIRRRGAFGRRL